MRRSVLTAAALALSLALASAASAQPGPDQGAPDLSRLHDALHLAPQQEGAWRAYVAAIAPDPQIEARRRAATTLMRELPTPRRIDLISAEMEEDVIVMHRQGAAVKAFYAQLSPEQQRAFDRLSLQAPQDDNGPLPPPPRN